MQRRASAAERPSRGIGFSVHDATGRGCAYAIDLAAGEALVFGSASALRVAAAGVLPAHFVVLPHDGKLVAASASAAKPAVLNGAPLPTTWTFLAIPSRIRLGAAAVDFFFVRESPSLPPRPLSRSDVALAAATSLKMHWRNASTSTRVLLGVVAILLLFLAARSGQEARSPAAAGQDDSARSGASLE